MWLPDDLHHFFFQQLRQVSLLFNWRLIFVKVRFVFWCRMRNVINPTAMKPVEIIKTIFVWTAFRLKTQGAIYPLNRFHNLLFLPMKQV